MVLFEYLFRFIEEDVFFGDVISEVVIFEDMKVRVVIIVK